MKKFQKVIYLLSYLLIINPLSAQVSDEIENGIRTALESKYGEIHNLGYIYDINVEKNEYQHWSLPITDPYNTLKDCYLFTANVRDGGVVGVYKNNTLLWDSGAIIDLFNNSGGYGIVGTMDLNNDSKVEIMANWDYGVTGFIQNIWIFSWDGNQGVLINETTPGRNPSTYKSVIWSYSYVTDVLDIDGDGIFEFKGVDYDNSNKTKLYSWNGSKYGDFGVTMPDYVPMNLLTAKVKCKVTKSQYGLLYNYTVENDSTSKQAIVRFSVEKPYEYVYAGSVGPNNKWFNYYSSNWEYIYNWDVNDDFHKFPFDYLLQGSIRTGFELETETPLVYIGNYYIQGKNGQRIADDDNLFENSFKGKMICGKPAPDTLVYTDFLDTVITYTNSSYSLGWITNEQTKDKYNTYFANAKNYLNQNNNNAAKTELQKVLTDCNTDSSSVLTSEAYALLYFNTDYLINRIPEGESGLPVKMQGGRIKQNNKKRIY